MKSILPDVFVPEVTFSRFMLDKMCQYGERIAAVDISTGEKMTYSEMVNAVNQLSAALYSRGLRKGDKIMLCSPNCIQYPIIIIAAIQIGAVVTTANPNYIMEELLTQIKDSKASFIITGKISASKIKSAAAEYGKIKEIISLGDVAGCTTFDHLLATGAGQTVPDVAINGREDVAVMPYSSGTTGSPKGVMLTHHNLVANLCQGMHPALMSDLIISGKSVALAVLPFYHIYGLVVIEMISLAYGGTLAVLPSFDLETTLKAIETHKITTLYLVPPLVLLLAKHPAVSQYDLSSVKQIFSGAAPLGRDLVQEISKRLKTDNVRQGYGLTETSPVTHMPPNVGFKSDSVGLTVANTECKVVDLDTGKDLGPNEDGEVCIRGPQVMKGYFGRDGATSAIIDKDGWLHTGDIGHYDEDHHFFIVDRLKELIKYKGLQVAPADLESLILSHPAVADVAVIGVPDDEAGELPRAYVVRKAGLTVTEHDVASFVASRVSSYKKLRGGVIFTDVIPKSASGKILRRLLRAQLAQNDVKSKL